jgi:hypothetical protein
MRKTIAAAFGAVLMSGGLKMCFAGGPALSITTSNQNVIITWPQTSTNYLLIETEGFDTYYKSNNVIYETAYRHRIISSGNYRTNGSNFFVVLPVDLSVNKFYMIQTNNFTPQMTP